MAALLCASLVIGVHKLKATKAMTCRSSGKKRRTIHHTTSIYSITGSFAEVERNARCAPSERSSRGSGQEDETASVLRVRNLAAAYMYMTCAQTTNRASRYWREITEHESCVGFTCSPWTVLVTVITCRRNMCRR